MIFQLDRLSIIRSRTQFTYRSILKIKNVNKGDSTNYSCTNKEEMSYFLQVHGKKSYLTFELQNLGLRTIFVFKID